MTAYLIKPLFYWLKRGISLILPSSISTASRAAGQRRPAEAPPEQKTGPDGGSGPDADPHHRTALPAYVQ